MSAEQAIQIRTLDTHTHFDACVRLQNTIWSYEPSDAMSQKVFQLAGHIGGQVIGAYQNDELVGYAMSLPGVRAGRPYLHSHHLGVLPAWRNKGVGRRLKLAQRDDVLVRGFDLMEWTFDPLEIRNAYLNICKLGAIARRYFPNFYGRSTSPLQGGLPTDRLVAEWWLRSERVERALRGESLQARADVQITVPAAIYEWKASALYRRTARQLQKGNAMLFEQAFSAGRVAVDYRRTAQGDGVYLLGPWPQPD